MSELGQTLGWFYPLGRMSELGLTKYTSFTFNPLKVNNTNFTL